MLIILDFGANDGCSIRKFEDILKNTNVTDYKIYSFEPNPYFKEILESTTSNNSKVIVSFKLVGTKNATTKLYLSQGGNDGSSIYSDKSTNKINSNLYVLCEEIDIVEFIKNLPDYSELWIKMDVEGSEYNIIPHMYKHNCLKIVNKLFMEWHYKKIPSITKQTHNEVLNMVKDNDIIDWNALIYSDQSLETKNSYQIFLNKIRDALEH